MQSSGHKVLIAGGAKGIGLALARKFHAAGNHVTIVGRDRSALDATSAELSGIETIRADIAAPEGIDAIVDRAAYASVLVNYAGVQCIRRFSGLSAEEIDREVRTNLLAPLHLIRRFLPLLCQRREAAIVNVTSILAIVPKEYSPVYCATKAALRSFTHSLRWQLEESAIRVFEVVPPVVDTNMKAGRTGRNISPIVVADEGWKGYLADKTETLVGQGRAAALFVRLFPGLAEHIVRRPSLDDA